MIKQYRKKPVVIEAMLLLAGTHEKEIQAFCPDAFVEGGETYIKTLEGKMHATHGDYIIKGVKGEFYPCKPDIFEETYEAVPDEVQS